MTGKKFDLEDRLVDFAASAVLFCKDLPSDMTGQYYGTSYYGLEVVQR